MKKKIKYIIILLIIILLVVVGLIAFRINKDKIEAEETTTTISDTSKTEDEEENVLIVGIEKQEEQVEETEQNTTVQQNTIKDAATLTQEIYDINGPIGTLVIPKTGLNTQIYSNVTVEKMEEMPCFLYTTGGLNEVGTTLFVGHNRLNGKLFSNNNKLVEGDEFYFTDYKGTEKKYTIYSKFITTDDDILFLNEDVTAPTIALSCCTDSGDMRIIILGKAE